jgi:hypothetical protein
MMRERLEVYDLQMHHPKRLHSERFVYFSCARRLYGEFKGISSIGPESILSRSTRNAKSDISHVTRTFLINVSQFFAADDFMFCTQMLREKLVHFKTIDAIFAKYIFQVLITQYETSILWILKVVFTNVFPK